MTNKNTICLWYDGTALEAATFYAETFPDSAVGAVHRAPGDYPSGKQGDVLTVEFTVMGIPCLGLNGGPVFKHSEAFSFQVATDDQAETDRLWSAIVDNGGQESECGWCKDKWGLSWQITPRVLTAAYTSPDRAAAKRAFDAMMGMRKIDIATIEAVTKSAIRPGSNFNRQGGSIFHQRQHLLKNCRVRSCCGALSSCLASPCSTMTPPSMKIALSATSRAKLIS